MSIVYFDASAFAKLLIEEDGTDIAVALWDGCDAAVSSRLSYPEVRAALAAAVRDHRLTNDEATQAVEEWEMYWSAVRPVELSRSVTQQAGELVTTHALRGADGVHLASALAIVTSDLVMAVWDQRLQAGAVVAGLAVAPNPETKDENDGEK